MRKGQVDGDPQRAERTTGKEYAVRFVFGGIVTAAVGIVGTAFGPGVAGLFLAFPAILPASVTLIAKHEQKQAAGADAIGAAAGSVGLAAFGLVVWALASRSAAWLVLLLAMVAWLAVSLAVWWGACRIHDREKGG